MIGSVEGSLLVLLVIVVFGPIVAERFRIPTLIGLIAGGILAGPFVLAWLNPDGLVNDLGAIGILYLMFLVGLGFNIRAFKANRRNAVIYGALGFVVPFGISLWLGTEFLGLSLLGSALVGAMWASNTLVAYPAVRAAGLQDNKAVTTAVSAGVAFDLMSLTVLAVATSSAVIAVAPISGLRASEPQPTLPVWLVGALLVGYALWALPKLSAWFFVRVGRSRAQRFVFALAGMAGGASIAVLGGIEGLIGAFLAGLGMNRLVPTQGLLMERLEFVGDTIFVPAFMVSIGLTIDPALLFDARTLAIAVAFTVIVVVGKVVAAAVTGAVAGFSVDEIGLMASLSFGQAASTLAIAQVGSNLGLFEQEIVNGAVLAIVATAFITSYGSRFFIRRIPRPAPPPAAPGERVLVDVRPKASDPDALMRFAGELARADDGLVVPFAVTEPGSKPQAQALVDDAVDRASALGLDSDGLVRVDESFVEGTLHLIEEHDASLVILSWEGPRRADYLFGADIDALGELLPIRSAAARIVRPWNEVIVVPGSPTTPWFLDDSSLAIDVGLRARFPKELPMTVVTESPDLFAEVLRSRPEITVVDRPGRHVLDVATAKSLVITPAHVLHDLPVVVQQRAVRALTDVSVVVVAGPHRLKVSRRGTRPGTLVDLRH